jgi:hypothetical protein
MCSRQYVVEINGNSHARHGESVMATVVQADISLNTNQQRVKHSLSLLQPML